MEKNLAFLNFLNDILNKIDQTGLSSGLFSFSLELPFRDLIEIYSLFIDKYNFSIFWEENNNDSFIVLDKCKSININDPNRFKIAKNFNENTFRNIINLDSDLQLNSFLKIFYFFSFRDNITKKDEEYKVPMLEAVLPKILITSNGDKVLLRMNIDITVNSSIQDSIYEFWSIRNKIINKNNLQKDYQYNKISINNFYKSFNENHKLLSKNLSKVINLINKGSIEKVVLSSKVILELKYNLNIIAILNKLKLTQSNACRYVWKRNKVNLVFGASPEKLFSYNKKKIKLEAIAGTCENGRDIDNFLKNDKNLREHNFVINYLISNLQFLNINSIKIGKLKVKKFGNINHLFTLITAYVNQICPFKLLDILHPSPAVCGFPKEKALNLIDELEDFERGNYAAPFGWVDIKGNADFRVALRGANISDQKIEFIAGSGIVKGSICEEEINEIKLKLESLAKQIFDLNSVNDIQ